MKPKAYYFDINKKMDDTIHSVQFDKNSRFIEINFLQSSQSVDLRQHRATIRAIKPDKTEVFNDLREIDASIGRFELELTEQLNAVAGDVVAQFEIYGENESLFTTNQFTIEVSKSLSRTKTISSDELGTLVNVLAEAQQYKNNFVKMDAKIDDEVAKMNAQLSQLTVNVANYQSLTERYNDTIVWDNAFKQAFNDLKNGGILLIPDGEYLIKNRVTLEDKVGIVINCSGTIQPVADKTPLIGTVTMNNLRQSTINSLKLDGNRGNIGESNNFGTQSLLNISNSSDLIINGLEIMNTVESAFNSDGNLDHIIFNNVKIENIGEHGFYFGGSNVKDIRFNHLYCKNIGVGSSNSQRAVAVIKLRNKTNGDIQHDQITIDGFEFKMDSTPSASDRQFIQAFDTLNVTLKNGSITGEDVSIFGVNTALEKLFIDNLYFNGRRLHYIVNDFTGWNVSTPITKPGAFNIEIHNSHLIGGNVYYGMIALFNNCIIDLNGTVWNQTMSLDTNPVTTFNNCRVICLSGYFSFVDSVKASGKMTMNYIYKNTTFKCTPSRTSPIFGVTHMDGGNILFENITLDEEHSVFIQTSVPIPLRFYNVKINGSIKTTTPIPLLSVKNAHLKTYILDTYATYDKLEVYDLREYGTGKRVDFGLFKATCLSYNTTVNLSLRYNRVDAVAEEELLVTNNKGIPFNYSVSNNVVTLDVIDRQDSDTIFTVIYSKQQVN
ncbi:BppU family phage baseplate upper protein [uncultured Turicibacter sp.]|uniref:BppU family phage baseplate upper protein n=1 Tax=uncultured Turicibacter sp. TaxID=297316 RepID=UPI002594CCB1|nr:BppU family phage baseplate upper protein [uncultured Turicibacter sp.]